MSDTPEILPEGYVHITEEVAKYIEIDTKVYVSSDDYKLSRKIEMDLNADEYNKSKYMFISYNSAKERPTRTTGYYGKTLNSASHRWSKSCILESLLLPGYNIYVKGCEVTHANDDDDFLLII